MLNQHDNLLLHVNIQRYSGSIIRFVRKKTYNEAVRIYRVHQCQTSHHLPFEGTKKQNCIQYFILHIE